MPITPKHRTVESRFRRLLADAALPEPDAVEYEPEAVVFFWHEPKAAVAVDFDGLDEDESVVAADSRQPAE